MAAQKVKKLYRSKKDRMLAGVCGGIGEYFGIDSTLVRILWVLLTFGGGAGIILYIICAIVVPEKTR
ncbi:PspC domain-containing protein [archaeon]|nr:PspC domain-containing protein [archaeon]